MAITLWNDLERKFQIHFFPSEKIERLKLEILSFKQQEKENLYQAWEKFKSLFKDCLHHHQTNSVLVHTFIESLEPYMKMLLDSTTDGQVLEKIYDELDVLLSCISKVAQTETTIERELWLKGLRILMVDEITTLAA